MQLDVKCYRIYGPAVTLCCFLEVLRTCAAISSSSLNRSLYDLLFSLWLRPATRPMSPSIPDNSVGTTDRFENVFSQCTYLLESVVLPIIPFFFISSKAMVILGCLDEINLSGYSNVWERFQI